MDCGDEHEGGAAADGQQRQKRQANRHTLRQIQKLEAMFKKCPHPDENQRVALSQELGLEPRQIKFWFQNRRTQIKAHHERADNCLLRAENDKIRSENVTMREALKNVLCRECSGPPISEGVVGERMLRLENARLKQELDRVSRMASKYLGRACTQMPPPMQTTSVGGMPGPLKLGAAPSHGLVDLLGGCSFSRMPPPQMPTLPPPVMEEKERPKMIETAARAMDEFIRLVLAGDQVWVKGTTGDDEWATLDVTGYDDLFSKPDATGVFRAPDVKVEGSKAVGHVFMNTLGLVEVFMNTIKWLDFFPGVVSKAHTVDVLVKDSLTETGRSESLIMMSEELHLLTPVVPTREFNILRHCKQLAQGLWAIVDVSVDAKGESSRYRRLPSGCLIADMPNGCSKVTWVEHMEMTEQTLKTNVLYQNLVLSGEAFGARRWVAALQRACDRFATFVALGAVPNGPNLNPSEGGTAATAEGNKSMMKLAQRMVRGFCTGLTKSLTQRWTPMFDNTDVSFRICGRDPTGCQSSDLIVFSAASSIWLPLPCEEAFALVRDVNARCQSDLLCDGNQVQEVSHIPTGTNPSNRIALLKGMTSSKNGTLILQESSTDASVSLLVYSPIDVHMVNAVLTGGNPSIVPLLISGFAILPDACRPGAAGTGASTSVVAPPPAPGCIVTVAYQLALSTSKLNAEYMDNASKFVTTTVQRIRAVVDCVGP